MKRKNTLNFSSAYVNIVVVICMCGNVFAYCHLILYLGTWDKYSPFDGLCAIQFAKYTHNIYLFFTQALFFCSAVAQAKAKQIMLILYINTYTYFVYLENVELIFQSFLSTGRQ